MRSSLRTFFGVWVAVACVASCGQDNAAGGSGSDGAVDAAATAGDGPATADAGPDGALGHDAGGTGNACTPPTAITLAPAGSTATVTPGTPFTLKYMATAHYTGQPDADVTAQSFFSVDDATLGAFNGATFSWGGTHGGATTVRATSCGVTGATSLTLALSASLTAGSGVDTTTTPPEFAGAGASTVAACAPTIVYPPDGVLVPPNTNVLEVHFLLGTPPNQTFDVSFSNGATDVHIYTKCNGTTPADGMMMNGGCIVELSQQAWDFIAGSNRGGDPVTVKVRGLGCDGTNAASSATRSLSFASDDLVGTLYYWSSIRISGGAVNSGGVYRYDFGVRGQTATPVLTPSSTVNPTGLCIGCHDISRDGRQMVFDYDDNDDDDEYGDVRTDVYDIVLGKPAQTIFKNGTNDFPPGYHTWNRETTAFLLSDGPGSSATPKGAFRLVSPQGTTLGYAQSGALRATTPDWAPDDGNVVFAVPPDVAAKPPAAGLWLMSSDLWFAGASLYTAPWDPKAMSLGAPIEILASNGTDNFYYPSYSPDGSLLVFDHAASGPNFHNPLARIGLVAAGAKNPSPLDLANANGGMSPTTNSWPRWTPFVQMYKGTPLLWLTFSSTRSYGLRIQQDTGKQNCYPNESPIKPVFSSTTNCTRTQLWMAAVRLDAGAVSSGQDVSWPAFWLPFQDLTTNNHLGQWAQQSFTGPCAKSSDCMAGACCVAGGCTTCPTPPPPPPATCASDANCATGECCMAGACIACGSMPGPDGGTTTTTGCNTCLDCGGQACRGGACTSCQTSADCCAPLVCSMGQCVMPIM